MRRGSTAWVEVGSTECALPAKRTAVACFLSFRAFVVAPQDPGDRRKRNRPQFLVRRPVRDSAVDGRRAQFWPCRQAPAPTGLWLCKGYALPSRACDNFIRSLMLVATLKYKHQTIFVNVVFGGCTHLGISLRRFMELRMTRPGVVCVRETSNTTRIDCVTLGMYRAKPCMLRWRTQEEERAGTF